jgi:hypothetical protein
MRLKSSRLLLFRAALIPLLLLAASTASSSNQCDGCPTLETRQIDLKSCIHFRYPAKQHVIKDEATMKSLVRNDRSRERCLELLKDIDFDRHTLVGTELNTGWCRDPPFTYRVFKEEAKKRYLLAVVYQSTDAQCRALSQYDLWVLVPKLPEQYEVAFEVRADPPEK